MKSVIVLTFGFLGLAFYEMSGGDEFAPASERMYTFSGAIVPETPQEAPVAAPAPVVLATAEKAKEVLPAHEAAVTRVSLNLTNVASAAKVVKARQVAPATTPAVEARVSTVPVNINSADTPAIIPSLIAPNDTGAAVIQTSAVTQRDTRAVTARRVNVRGGPGTDYGIVAKMVQGDRVEILEDTGAGWVRMRNIDDGTEGWMADFLLSNG